MSCTCSWEIIINFDVKFFLTNYINFKVCHTWSSTEDRSRGRSEEGSREEVEEEEEEKKELGERRREEWEGGRDRELDGGKDG